MDELRQLATHLFADPSRSAPGPEALLASLSIALFVGLAVAWVYQRTHSGLSYSRGYTQSLVVLTLGASLLIFVIGDSLVTAFGLLGALAIVRFRNVLKDTRDTVFVFFALVLGMATGTRRYGVALVGAAVLLAAVLWLYATQFGSKGRFDGHVTYRVAREAAGAARERVAGVLDAFCRAVRQVTLHDAEDAVEVVCAVRLRDPDRVGELVDHLRAVPGVGDASVVVRDAYTEL